MTLFPILDVPTAQTSLLLRRPPDEIPVPPAVSQRLADLFGEALTPAQAVQRILRDVRTRGDQAVRDWGQRLDGAAPDSLRVPPEELRQALAELPADLRAALQESADRVRAFYQRQPLTSWITNASGGTLGQWVRPIRRVGLYVPAGTAPLPSSVIMSAVPAQVAGVPEIVLAAPPARGTGRIAPVILAAAALLGIDEVYVMGGAQAVAALAYGTPSVPPVDKIFGPGNLFVTLAKREVYGLVGIDSLAGPTETLIIADDTARPEWVAADLLAQAEHDVLASAVLLTPSARLAEAVRSQVLSQMQTLSRISILQTSLSQSSGAVLTRDLDEAAALANAFGAEHLCLSVADPWRLAEKITCAGGVFLGEHSCEVLGDYAAGPSHVMPTGGSARFSSPVNVWDFVKLISLVALDPQTAAQISRSAARLADAEGLDGHAAAARMRQ